MLREKTEIGVGLLFAVTLSTLLGNGNQQTAYLAAKFGGHSGYLGLLGAFVLSTLVIFVAFDLQKMYPGKSLLEYAPLILGKVLGKVIGFIFLLLILFLLIWSIRSTAEVINLYYLQRTPQWFIAGLFIFAITYLAYQGIEGITKTCSFMLPLALCMIILTLLSSYQYFNFDRVRPIFYINQGTLSSVIHLFYAFFTLAIIFVILPYLADHQKGRAAVLKATGMGAAILFFFIMANIGAFGAKGVIRYSWPLTELTRTIDIPYLLQSFGLFYIVAWLSQIYITAGACYFAAAQGYSQLFSYLHYKWFIFMLLPIIIVLTLILPGVIEVRLFFEYFRLAGCIILFVLPLLLWIVAKLKNSRRDVSHD